MKTKKTRRGVSRNTSPERQSLVTELGHLLRDARIEHGLTQRQAAELAGVPQCTIVRWEFGQREPRVYNLVRLAKSMGILDQVGKFLEKSAEHVVVAEAEGGETSGKVRRPLLTR